MSQHPRRKMKYPGTRIQMLLACGAFVISEPITPNDFLRPNIDFIEIVSKDDLIESKPFFTTPRGSRHWLILFKPSAEKSWMQKISSARRIDRIRLQEVQPFLPNKTRSDLDILTLCL